MAPLDWDRILAIEPSDLDEAEADKLYSPLTQFELAGETEISKLQQLFKLTQRVLEVKGGEAQIYLEELDKMAENQGKATAQREQELVSEVTELKRDIRRLEGSGTGGTEDVRALRNEIREAERSNSLLTQELQDMQRELNAEKRMAEQYVSKAEHAEKELIEVKQLYEQSQDDTRELQRQLELQRDSKLSKRDEGSDYRSVIRYKNKELNDALDEINNLTDANDELQKKCEEMKAKLEEAVQQMDNMTDEYTKLRAVLQQSDDGLDHYKKDNEKQRARLEDLTQQQQSRRDIEDEVMVAVNAKVEEWQAILAKKDEELLGCQKLILQLQEQRMLATLDADRASVAVLTKAVEEKDKQIEALQQQLTHVASDMETSAALIDDLQAQLSKGPATTGSDRQQQRLLELRSTIKYNATLLKEADTRVHLAEEDAKVKDRQLAEALNRMREYEAGEYGLAEAVSEIKDGKVQIGVRDAQVEELTRYINTLELKMNAIWEENENLREKLGMEPTEPLSFRETSNMKKQQDRAVIITLEKEVENLEEERLELKKHIRQLSQLAGKRASELGVSADALAISLRGRERGVTESTAQSQPSTLRFSQAETIKRDVESDQLKQQSKQRERDMEKLTKSLEVVKGTSSAQQAIISELQQENKSLEQGMMEILEDLKANEKMADGTALTVRCPSLEKYLSVMESRAGTGRVDAGVYMKAQVDHLQGRCDELRSELRLARADATRGATVEQQSKQRVSELEAELHLLRESGGAGRLHRLPDDLAQSSAYIISSQNEHLIHTLHELSKRDELVSKQEDMLESYRRKLAVVRHQQGLFYKEHLQAKEDWDMERSASASEQQRQDERAEADAARLREFDRLLDTLACDDAAGEETRRRLGEATRAAAVLRANEAVMARRYTSIVEAERAACRENARLRADAVAMETAIAERLGYLQRHKDMSSFKIRALQRALEDSVPQSQLEAANRQFTDLTEKYRDLLQRSNSLVDKTERSTQLEAELAQLQEDSCALKKELETEKERRHAYEAAVEKLSEQGREGVARVTSDEATASLAKQLAVVEMKELNERQRADHAGATYERQKQNLRHLEDRNVELEEKFAAVAKMNVEAQKLERKLRDELEGCVTKAASDADKSKLAELETTEASLRVEMSKLREVAEIATFQRQAIEAMQTSREKEVTSLRQQLLDIQVQSDEKTVIGKLHHQLVALQVSEGLAVRKLEKSTNQVSKLTAQILRLEQRLDEKDQRLFHLGQESRSKVAYLKVTLHDVRRSYAGAVPLDKQERFSLTLLALVEERDRAERERRAAAEQRHLAETRVAELRLQRRDLRELVGALKDARGAEKVVEWHGKMEALKLVDLRQGREIEKLREQISFLEACVKSREASITNLEADNVRLAHNHEERQLAWEHREVELERVVERLERQQELIVGATSQFEEAVGSLPNPDQPVASQLEQAVTTIKRNVHIILETQKQAKIMKEEKEDLERRVQEAERGILSRDRVIAELRLRMPASADRDRLIVEATRRSAAQAAMPAAEYESNQGLAIAKETVSSLQTRLSHKEETVVKYQEFLTVAREEMRQLRLRHEQQLRAMQQQLQRQQEHEFAHFKQAAMELINKPGTTVPTNKQLARLNELEDMAVEQNNAMGELAEKLRHSHSEVDAWKRKLEATVKEMTDDRGRVEEEHRATESRLCVRAEEVERRLRERVDEAAALRAQLDEQRSALTRSPSSSMRQLVERLKTQLTSKEKEYQALSKALAELRSDMVQAAQQNVLSHAATSVDATNVQRLVDKQTKQLKSRVAELEGQLVRLKKEPRKAKDGMAEASDFKQQSLRKDDVIQRLKVEKTQLEEEIEALKQKVQRVVAHRNTRTEGAEYQNEVGELRRKVSHLEEQLQKQKAEKPLEREPLKKGADEIVRWEEKKKWQKAVERLKAKITEKEKETENQQHTITSLKEHLTRAERVKTATDKGVKWASARDESIQKLKKNLFDVEEENAALKRKAVPEDGATVQHLEMANKSLVERLQEVERQLHRPEARLATPGSESALFAEMQEREAKLQKKILRLTREVADLTCEAEQAKTDVPRLQGRVKDLEHYVEVLKSEQGERAPSAASSQSASNLKRIGMSGKSAVELEKTISLMKKVIERLQAENEVLKKSSQTNQQLDALRKEKALRERLQSNVDATEQAVAKLTLENDRLQRDLKKEVEVNQSLRIELGSLQVTNNELERSLLELETKVPAKPVRMSVASRMMEERVSQLESALKMKSEQLSRLQENNRQRREEAGWDEQTPKNSAVYRSMMNENIDLKVALRSAQQENEQLRSDSSKMRKELGNFDPSFFEELEDLKYNYQQAVQKNSQYEEKLTQLSHQFGIDVQIPGI